MKTGIEEAAHLLSESLREDSNVVAVGVGKDVIHVYTVKRVRGYPQECEGWPVKVTRTGKITLNSSEGA